MFKLGKSGWLPVLIIVLLAGCSGADRESSEPLPAVPPATVLTEQNANGDKSDHFSKPFDGKLIDLTHAFDETTIYWPTETGFQLEKRTEGFTELGYFYAANRFAAPEHGGTHIDAPIHFFKDHQTVDQIPLDRLIGPGALVDVTQQCDDDRDYQIGVSDLRAWEERHQRQLVDVILLLRTGFARHWPDRKAYLGTDTIGAEAVPELHFPGLAPEAAKWLVEHRQVQAVGIDTASIDHGQSRRFQSHVTLFEHNVPVFENVANLDLLPETAFTVLALPMKIGGGTGGPLRIVAIVGG